MVKAGGEAEFKGDRASFSGLDSWIKKRCPP